MISELNARFHGTWAVIWFSDPVDGPGPGLDQVRGSPAPLTSCGALTGEGGGGEDLRMPDDCERSPAATPSACRAPREKPPAVLDEGLTTRERRNRPLVILYTGQMKGKSTAAFGLALRAWTAGLPIGVFQFVKSATWKVGEKDAFRALGRVHEETGEGASVVWHTLGEGWSWSRRGAGGTDPAVGALEGWRQVQRDLAAQRYGLYVLDEFTYPITWGWVNADEVVATLGDRPGFQHVVITGRDADPRLVEAADLVAELVKVKHPMDAGQRGQRGIEW